MNTRDKIKVYKLKQNLLKLLNNYFHFNQHNIDVIDFHITHGVPSKVLYINFTYLHSNTKEVDTFTDYNFYNDMPSSRYPHVQKLFNKLKEYYELTR